MAVRRSKEQLEQRLAQARAEIARFDPADKLVRTRELVEDIAEQTVIEEDLRRYQLLVAHSLDIILFVRGHDGHILEANDAAVRVYGYSRDELLNMTVYDLRLPEAKGQAAGQLAQASSRGVRFQAVHQRKDGSAFPIEVSSCGIDVGGTRILMSIIRDITDRKRAEEALRKSEQQLKELNETLERRVAERTAEAEWRATQLQRMAAELTNTEQRERKRLAQVLHDHLQQLLVGAKLNLGRALGRVRDGIINEALQQADQLLDDSLIASRSLTAELSPTILQEGTMPDILRWLAGWAREKYGLVVRVRIGHGADIDAAEIRVVLFGAVRELLLNVIKHAGVRQARIGMRCLAGHRVHLIVADRGVGFDLGSKSSQPTGSGFGLFSIQERLNLLGGRCHIAGRPGKGTRISLIVPRQLQAESAELPRAAIPTPPVSAEEEASARSWSPERPIRVLLADDHTMVRDGLASLLQLQPDIQVVAQASDGQQAVDLAEQLRPDVVLMDVSMPRVGGIDATRRIVRQVPSARVVGLSMFPQEDIALQMAQAGAVAYLTKTAAPEAVIAAIYQCIKRSAPPSA